MHVRMFSKAEQERLHLEGVDMSFGGGRYLMRPEQAASFAYGLVQLARTTGSYRRVQLCPVEERLLIEAAKAREQTEASLADRDQASAWLSSRPR